MKQALAFLTFFITLALIRCGSVNVTDLDPKQFSSIPTGANTSCNGVDNGFVPNVIPIFASKGCAAGSCHSGSSPGGGLNLDASSQSNEALFVSATGNGRVSTLSPQNSRLLRKPLGLDGHGGSKQFSSIADASYVTIFCWIAAGAQNTTSTTAVATPTPTATPTP